MMILRSTYTLQNACNPLVSWSRLYRYFLGRESISLPGASIFSSTANLPQPVQIERRWKSTVQVPYPELSDISDEGIHQKGTGKIYDKKPFKFSLVKGKKYSWCACGWSKTQPFCDGHHANKQYRITLRPLIFIAPETGDYWLCNCKQTSKRPFCDGTHRNENIQAAIKS